MGVLQLLAFFLVPLAIDGASMSSEESSNDMMNFQKKMMMETRTCLDLKFDPAAISKCFACMIKGMNSSGVWNRIHEGKFPGKDLIGKMMTDYATCTIKESQVSYNETHVNLEELMEKNGLANLPKQEEDKVALSAIIQKCLNERQGTTAEEMLLNLNKCMLFGMFNHCDEKGELDDVGMSLVVMGEIYTMNEPSKCASVDVPDDAKLHMTECFAEARENFSPLKDTLPDFAQQSQMTKMKHLKARIIKDFIVESGKCSLMKLDLYDQVNFINMKKGVEYVKNMSGWESIPEKRDQVINAMEKCGPIFSADVSDEVEVGSSEDEAEEQFEKKRKYDKCFLGKFAQICGMNGELAEFFSPTVNGDFMREMKETFMEVGGDTAKTFIKTMKEKMAMFGKMMGSG